MPSRELNKVVKMAFDTESCTAKSKAESNDEGYEEAEKNLQWVHLVPKRKSKVCVEVPAFWF